MDKKDEIISSDGQEVELDSGVQALADMADKMGEENPESDSGESGFDSNGIHKETGTKYDPEGYDVRGFDETGVDREGFDRNGLGTDYRDREGYSRYGYDKEGYDRRGFNRDGIHRNGTRYNEDGFNSRGYDKNGYDVNGRDIYGRDEDGYNEKGYDLQGYNRDGYDRNGLTKEMKAARNRAFAQSEYDENGLRKEYREGASKGYMYDKEGFRWHKEKGPFGEKWVQSTEYNKDGYNRAGYNRFGYDIEGYDQEGYNREGYNREGLDRDGNTPEFNSKFNKYGVDENGYMKNGEIDPDVEFAISFSESGIRDQGGFAAKKGMDEKEVRDKIELARKKCPNVDEIIKDLLLTGNKIRVAAISNDCDKFIGGELSTKEFWDKHPKLNISDILSSFISDPDKKKQFSDRTIESLVLDSDNIEGNLRIFGTSQYDVSGALKGIENFKKIYTRFGTDGTPEQLQKKRENTKKIFDTIKYLNRYKSRNLDSLLGSRQSFDGGQTLIEFNGETIGQAMDALKKDKKLVCVQTVRDYIINQAKS